MSPDPQQTWRELIDQKVQEALAEVHAAADAEMKGLFEEAFNAGKAKGRDEAAYEYAAFAETGEPDFETWFARLVERLRSS